MTISSIMAQIVQWSLENHNHCYSYFWKAFLFRKAHLSVSQAGFLKWLLLLHKNCELRIRTKIESIFLLFLPLCKDPIQIQCMFCLSSNWRDQKDLAIDEQSFLRINNRSFSPTSKGKKQHILKIILVYIPL